MDRTDTITAPADAQASSVGKHGYLLAGQDSELERLLLQSRVWEPSGRQLLSRLSAPADAQAVDVGCGALGWLRILSEWVGPSGRVVGTDIDHKLLAVARSFLDAEDIGNVDLVIDDLFDTHLQPRSFDLVHARYVIAPLGRARDQVAAHRRLVKPGGWLVLGEWDIGSWHYNPPAPAIERLIGLFYEVFAGLGGQAGRELPTLLREIGAADIGIDAHVIALEPGHPYLRMPLQFSQSLQPRLEQLISADELTQLRRQAETELDDPARWATTFTLIQSWGKITHHP
jgi:SAM-dependent methyltransferase